jgi:hypothetical protein
MELSLWNLHNIVILYHAVTRHLLPNASCTTSYMGVYVDEAAEY